MAGLQNSDSPDRAGFDMRSFARVLRVRLNADGRSMRAVAPEIGVTLNDISRATGGQPVQIGRVIALCDWAGVDIRSFYLRPDRVSRPQRFTFDQVEHVEKPQQ